MGNGIEEGKIRTSFEKENDWVQLRFGTEMGSKGNNEIIDGCGGVICREDNCTILPVVVVRTSIRSVVADLEEVKLCSRKVKK